MFELLIGLGGYCAVSAALVWRVSARFRQQQRAQLAHLPDLLRRLSAQIVAGASLNQAVSSLVTSMGGATPPSLSPSQWLTALARDLPSADLDDLATLVDVLASEGGSPLAHIDALTQRIQVRTRARSMAVVAMAPVKGQARLVLFVMPIMVLMVFALEPRATATLFTTLAGVAVLAVCIALNALIWVAFQRLGRVR